MGRTIKILVVIIVIGIVGYVGYDQIGKWHTRNLKTALEQEREGWQKKTEKLEEKITSLQEELEQYRGTLVPEEKLFEVFGEEAVVVSPERKEIRCEELEQQITSFFTYLDKKRYGEIYGLEEGTYDLFQQIVKRISEKPPMVTGEMKDISTLISNMAHFYRVLGRKQVELIKEIIKNESEVIETIMATIFILFTSGDRCEEIMKGPLSLKVLNEYAGFFLNTLAGKSYLLRRDSKVRILTSYYCVLVLDKANDETLNRHGIDIRPHIDFLLYEIRNQRGLIHKKQYLAELEGLKKKYQM